MPRHTPRLRFFSEAMGLKPFPQWLRQARTAILGEQDVPPSRAGLSSLAQFRPKYGPMLWAGRYPVPRTALVTNLFNHTQTPIHEGWSTKKTQVQDFRGRRLTYNSHNGTDISIPVGTPVLAAAPGKVVRIIREYNRGGLKIFIDHGNNLMTCTVHLARELVAIGDSVRRGQTIAISGYSGLDALITFPWGTPHIHFNVWLNGVPVDPFPHSGLPSMWRSGDHPVPQRSVTSESADQSEVDEDALNDAIADCKTPSSRERMQAMPEVWRRAAEFIAEQNYYPTRFPQLRNPYTKTAGRTARLDLPFSAEHFDKLAFIDDL
ncbi:MAG: murein DD-endopeptidase [Myxococcota bacterium]|jgi:murein DD-endopeptidase MepM/ murein hydrolase activator NlpD